MISPAIYRLSWIYELWGLAVHRCWWNWYNRNLISENDLSMCLFAGIFALYNVLPLLLWLCRRLLLDAAPRIHLQGCSAGFAAAMQKDNFTQLSLAVIRVDIQKNASWGRLCQANQWYRPYGFGTCAQYEILYWPISLLPAIWKNVSLGRLISVDQHCRLQ